MTLPHSLRAAPLIPSVIALLSFASTVPAGCGSNTDGAGASDGGVLADGDSRDGAAPVEDAQSDSFVDPRPSLAKLAGDDVIWKPLKNGGSCGLREGVVVPDPFPKRTWSSCGQGCRLSNAALPFDLKQYTSRNIAAGDSRDGDAYIMLAQGSTAGATTRIERLSDGATIAATLARGAQPTCRIGWRGGAAPFFFSFFDRVTEKVLFGRAVQVPGSPVRWHDNWISGEPIVATERFMWDDAYGIATYGALAIYPSPGATVSEDLEPGGALVHGSGAQLLWGYGGATISSYTKTTGVVDLITLPQPRVPLGERMSPTRIVWVDAIRGGDLFDGAQWHWSPRTTVTTGVVVHDGPSLPLRGGLIDMQTYADWAASDGLFGTAEPYDTRIFMWNIATGQSFVLPHRAGHHFERVFAITATELIVGERLSTSDYDQVDHLVRIALASIPQLVADWSK